MKKHHTYFFDIDGTIFYYRKFETYKDSPAVLTPGTLEKLNQIRDAGHMIVLTTARPAELYGFTQDELHANKVPYDKIIMGLERGPRHLVNDLSPSEPGNRAIAWNLLRNEGLRNVGVVKA